MGVMERRVRHKAELRQQILDAAREVFVNEGYESVSMRKIAEKIEYSPTTIYLYFKDKAELLNCLCEEILARIAAVIERILAEGGDPVARLHKGLCAYVEFGLENSHDYRVAFLIAAKRATVEEQPVGWKVYGYLRSTVEDCVQSGKFRPVDVECATQTLWASAHGITALLITFPEFPWAERNRLIDLAIGAAINGLSV